MLIQHKITKQIVDTDKPEEYLKTGVWVELKDEKVGGVFGNIAKTELMKVANEHRNLPKSTIVEAMKKPVQAVKVDFTDDLI